MAQAEVDDLAEQQSRLEEELRALLLPRDPNDDRNVFVEIRAGAGGDEAGALRRRSRPHVHQVRGAPAVEGRGDGQPPHRRRRLQGGHPASSRAEGAWSRLKFERGVHRVQRVPATESSGRIHTSTVTVAVLPEAEDVDIKVEEKDVPRRRLPLLGARRPGRQHHRLGGAPHPPAHRARGDVPGRALADQEPGEGHAGAQGAPPRAGAGASRRRPSPRTGAARWAPGERSERIRTYNFPQGRVSDHRIGLTLHKLPAVIEGDLDELIDGLTAWDQSRKLAETHGVTHRARRRSTVPRPPREGAAAPGGGAGCPTARQDAEWLLAAVLGVERFDLYLEPAGRVVDGRRRGATARSSAGAPPASRCSTCSGFEDFRGLRLRRHARRAHPAPGDRGTGRMGGRGPRARRPPTRLVADVGTGSGAIACALAAACPGPAWSRLDCLARRARGGRGQCRARSGFGRPGARSSPAICWRRWPRAALRRRHRSWPIRRICRAALIRSLPREVVGLRAAPGARRRARTAWG